MSDLISRADAIDAMAELQGRASSKGELAGISKAWKKIKSLPSAQPKRGKWKKISPAGIYECSQCGKTVMTGDIEAYDFCHGCGAKMKGADDDSNSK